MGIYFATETRIGVILLGCAAALSLKHPRARLAWRRVRQSRIAPDALAVAACTCAIFITGGTPSSGSRRAHCRGGHWSGLGGFRTASICFMRRSHGPSCIGCRFRGRAGHSRPAWLSRAQAARFRSAPGLTPTRSVSLSRQPLFRRSRRRSRRRITGTSSDASSP
jgi:hypothetical protein